MGKEFWLGRPPGEVEMGEMEKLMQSRAQGQGGPSAAELMMDRGMQQQISAGRSMAAGARGMSPGLAMRQAGLRESSAMSDVGQQMGILRAQEQEAAMRAAAQMELERGMYNAARQQRSGMLGSIMGTAGQMGGALLSGPWGAAQSQPQPQDSVASMQNRLGATGHPSGRIMGTDHTEIDLATVLSWNPCEDFPPKGSWSCLVDGTR